MTSVVDLWRRVPWWAQALLVFGAARVVTTVILLVFAAGQQANSWTGASPGYADFASMWDGRWYNIVAEVGYPSELPLTGDGHVAEPFLLHEKVGRGVAEVLGVAGLVEERAPVVGAARGLDHEHHLVRHLDRHAERARILQRAVLDVEDDVLLSVEVDGSPSQSTGPIPTRPRAELSRPYWGW